MKLHLSAYHETIGIIKVKNALLKHMFSVAEYTSIKQSNPVTGLDRVPGG